MKNFKVLVIDRKTKQVLEDHTEIGKTLKLVEERYRIRYRFHPNQVSVKVERLIKEPGVQTNLIDMIAGKYEP
jgi:hypothetical protein